MSLEVTIISIAVCLLAEAYFSSSEVGLLSAHRTRLLMLAEGGSRPAELALVLLDKPQRLLGTTLLGTNLSTVTAATLLSSYMIGTHGENGDIYAALIFSPLTMIFGEILPKSIAQAKADWFSLKTATPLSLLARLFTPGHYLFGGVYAVIDRLFPSPAAAITRDDLRILLDLFFKDLPQGDREMILRIFEFGETRVYEAMKPLVEVQAIPESADVNEAVDLIHRRGFSRLPVYRDRIDNIVGVINAFDLLEAESNEQPIAGLVKPVIYIPRTATIDYALKQLHSRTENMPVAIVVNEYGGAVGIISIEDLLEEVVGEIEDEHDRNEETFRSVRKGVFDVSGRIKIDDLSEKIGIILPDGDYETIGGMLLEHFGRIPKAGDQLEIRRINFTVMKSSEKAIKLIRIRLPL